MTVIEPFNIDLYKGKYALSKVHVNGFEFLDIVEILEETTDSFKDRRSVVVRKHHIVYSRGDSHNVAKYHMDLDSLEEIDINESPEYFL